ncbi:hypothetical protein SAMN04488045_2090 [Thalassococcus halodurans]|uniref:Uncharacterized protein n=1 Tax=Thalassococcus halodurans TaxID=373675 RepID=A0A1H5YGP2_9RHOB|nr:hypothetical protein [Thalassococcus halodurans]SEG23269.1 hypothetical protein SAMN04488045_2090 [Thalassococcus halodurans]
MLGIANILALSKLTSDTPDEVRKAATLMIVGGNKNPLISGIASANIVEEATKSAVEATSAKTASTKATEAKVVAEARATSLETEIATIRPLINAVAERALVPTKSTTTEGDGYTQMLSALKGETTVESVMDKLVSPVTVAGDQLMPINSIETEADSAVKAVAAAAASVKEAANNDLSDKQKRHAATMFVKSLDLPASVLSGVKTLDELKSAIAKNS